jgi:uncharacterized heparinase superfamily protein
VTFVNQIAQLLYDQGRAKFPNMSRFITSWCQALEWASVAVDASQAMEAAFVHSAAAQDRELVKLLQEAARSDGDLRADALHRLACAAVWAATQASAVAEAIPRERPA